MRFVLTTIADIVLAGELDVAHVEIRSLAAESPDDRAVLVRDLVYCARVSAGEEIIAVFGLVE